MGDEQAHLALELLPGFIMPLAPVLEMDFEGYSPGLLASQCGTVEFCSKPAMQIGH